MVSTTRVSRREDTRHIVIPIADSNVLDNIAWMEHVTPDRWHFDSRSLCVYVLDNKAHLLCALADLISAQIKAKATVNIAYFHENIKPLVLNSTNSKTIKRFAKSSFIEDWTDILLELYPDHNVKYKGETVGGIRIKPTQPKLTKPRLTASSERYAAVLKSCTEKTTTIDVIKSVFDLPADIEKKLNSLLNA